jgi:hypothetical protein
MTPGTSSVPMLGTWRTNFRALLPIPQNDIDTAPGITQNPGY